MKTTSRYYVGSQQVPVYVEVEDGDAAGVERVGAAEKLAGAASRTLGVALKSACAAAEEALGTLRNMASQAEEIEISFGVRLAASGDVIITQGEAEASFAFKLVWKQPKS